VTTSVYPPRPGRPAPDGPYEGVPAHLHLPLERWLEEAYTLPQPTSAMLSRPMDRVGLERLAAHLQIDARGMDARGLFASMLAWADYDEERLLDLLHYTLLLPIHGAGSLMSPTRDWESLDTLLELGRSVWRATEQGLVRRVDPTAAAAYEQAVKPQDAASEELKEAWSKAYGRDLDASDAWDHANKAVEAILRGIISPSNTSATLGTLIRDLRNGAHKFDFVLTNDLGGVQTLLAML
jgi:hypothetical protein